MDYKKAIIEDEKTLIRLEKRIKELEKKRYKSIQEEKDLKGYNEMKNNILTQLRWLKWVSN